MSKIKREKPREKNEIDREFQLCLVDIVNPTIRIDIFERCN